MGLFSLCSCGSMKNKDSKTLYDFSVKDTNKEMVSLSQYKGKVLLIVNTATQCGLSPQLSGLEKLQEEFADKGLVVLGFPCNQFKEQAPEDDAKIKEICELKYGAKFKQFSKIDVNGANEDPLYTWLKGQKGGFLSNKIKWNFTKFLIDRNGNVIERYSPITKPESIKKDISKLL